jgi:hypothetical protein
VTKTERVYTIVTYFCRITRGRGIARSVPTVMASMVESLEGTADAAGENVTVGKEGGLASVGGGEAE